MAFSPRVFSAFLTPTKKNLILQATQAVTNLKIGIPMFFAARNQINKGLATLTVGVLNTCRVRVARPLLQHYGITFEQLV